MKYRDIETGEIVEAVQYTDPAKPPKGVSPTKARYDEDSREWVANAEADEVAFVETKDPDGAVDVAVGTYIITNENGDVSLCHERAFGELFAKAG